MEPIVLDLPEDLHDFVQQAAESAGLPGPSAYFLQLIEEARKEKWVAYLEQMAEEAIASGPSIPWAQGQWEEMRRKLHEKHGNQNSDPESLGEIRKPDQLQG